MAINRIIALSLLVIIILISIVHERVQTREDDPTLPMAAKAPGDDSGFMREDADPIAYSGLAMPEGVTDAGRASVNSLKLPSAFVENRGQFGKDVLYGMRMASATAWLFESSVTHQVMISDPSKSEHSDGLFGRSIPIEMSLVGADENPQILGSERQGYVTNYYRGSNPDKWQSGVPSYGAVSYMDIYPGIDWVFKSDNDNLKYEFVVSPGSNTELIRVRYKNAKGMAINSRGDLVVDFGLSSIIENAPVAFQSTEKGRLPVEIEFKILSADVFGFILGDYDRNKTLIIDPRLTYSTLFGGNGYDEGREIRLDADHNIYISMSTSSSDLDTLNAEFGYAANIDVAIAKFDSSGKTLLFCTYYGGSADDWCGGMVLDNNANVYFNGHTSSADLSTWPANVYDSSPNGSEDCFLAKLDTDGTLIYSTYFGGGSIDQGRSICVDGSGNAIIVGKTGSPPGTFPVRNAFQGYLAGSYDGFVAKFNQNATGLIYSTYYGGSNEDRIWMVDIDANDNIVMVGRTASNNLPLFQPFQPEFGEYWDGFVLRLNSNGQPIYGTYLGGIAEDYCESVASDDSGYAYVTGATNSSDFPISAGAYDSLHSGNREAFITKIDPAGNLVYSTFIGGSGADLGYAIAIGPHGDACITGMTKSLDIDWVLPFKETMNNASIWGDVLIAHINHLGNQLLFCTPVGDSMHEFGAGIVIDEAGYIYLLGGSGSDDFPVTPDAYDTSMSYDDNWDEWDSYFMVISPPETVRLEVDDSFIDPDDSLPHITSDSSMQFSAYGNYYGSGEEDLTGQVFWLSSDTAVATIDNEGTFEAVSAGRTLITAGDGYVLDTISVIVEPSIYVEAQPLDTLRHVANYEVRVAIPDMLSEILESDTVQLRYRAGGASNYHVSNMNEWIRDAFIDTIPKNLFTERGVEYYIYVAHSGVQATRPSGNPPDNPYRVRLAMPDYAIPPLVTGDKYQLIGFSFDIDPRKNSPADVFEDDLGTYDPWVWRCARWDAYEKRYVEYPELKGPVARGQGFIIASRLHTRLDAGGYSAVPAGVVDDIGYDSLILRYGWNLIASLFAFDISWSECSCADHVELVGLDVATGSYYPATVMKPHTGYWAWSDSEDAVLYIPSVAAVGDHNGPQSPGTYNDWHIDLVLSSNGVRDEFISLGTKPGAGDGVDNHDYHKPPPLGRYVTLSTVSREETGRTRELAHDFREASEGPQEYDLVVRGNTGEPCRLSIGQSSAIPDRFRVILYDNELNRYYDVNATGGLVLPRIPDETGLRYTLYVGDPAALPVVEEDLSTIPRDYELHQNYPNPFNSSTVIEFSLPVPQEVKVEIYNILGQRVSVLIEGVLPAGNHVLTWDGSGKNGRQVESGVYFCRMTAGRFTASRKMVLLN